MTDLQPFIDTILERHYADFRAGRPYDDGPRLVMADQLEEMCKQWASEWAEFIREQCHGRGGRYGDWRTVSTVWDLLDHGSPIRGINDVRVKLSRGFPALIRVPTLADWLRAGPEVCKRVPVERVEVGDRAAWLLYAENFHWWNRDMFPESGADGLPTSVFSLLEGSENSVAIAFRSYPTKQAANEALSRALILGAIG